MSSQKRYFQGYDYMYDDHKDQLIALMKSELQEFKANEKDYNELSNQLKNLEHSNLIILIFYRTNKGYNLLHEEKMRTDDEVRLKNETHMKTVANLKTDIDTLKQLISEKNIEIQELRSDSVGLNEILENRALDMQNLQSEIQSIMNDRSKIIEELKRAEMQIEKLKDEKKEISNDNFQMKEYIGQLSFQCQGLEKKLKEQELEFKKLSNQNYTLEGTIENLDLELKNKISQLNLLDQQLAETNSVIINQQDQNKELEKQKENYRLENIQNLKNFQNESLKVQEMVNAIVELDRQAKQREQTTQINKKEIEEIKKAHTESLEDNFQLIKQLDQSERKIDKLKRNNEELIEELERSTQMDEEISNLLSRKSKLKEIKFKVGNIVQRSPYQNKLNY